MLLAIRTRERSRRGLRLGRGVSSLLICLVLAAGLSPRGAHAGFVLGSPSGFTAFVTLQGFDDAGGNYDGSFTLSLGSGLVGANPVALLGGIQFDGVSLDGDIHAVGGITVADNAVLGLMQTYNGDTAFSGALQIDTAGAFVFDGVNVPAGYPASWTVSYDGMLPANVFPVVPPLPAPSGSVAGSLTFTVQNVGVDFLDLLVTETVDAVAAPGWDGFEAALDTFDLLGIPFGGTRGTIDFGLEVAAGTQINTPLPGALWLLGSAALGLGGWRRRREVRRQPGRLPICSLSG